MSSIDNFLILNEERNAIDYLNHALLFLSQVEDDLYSLKWFIIAFHGAVYSFMLLALQKTDAEQIYREKKPQKSKKELSPLEEFDSKLVLQFLDAYKLLKKEKSTLGVSFKATELITICMKKLNNELRNQVIHFKPMTLGYEPWYPAEVCLPLIAVLEFCLDKSSLTSTQHTQATASLQNITRLLKKHTD